MSVITSRSAKETQRVAKLLAEELASVTLDGARVVALVGDLGAGKTTFAQGFARALGIKENVLSPTFVIMKVYELPKTERRKIKTRAKHFIHIDCYRLESPDDLLHLGFHNLLRDRDAIILIEWAEKIKNILPGDTVWAEFEYGDRRHTRIITME